VEYPKDGDSGPFINGFAKAYGEAIDELEDGDPEHQRQGIDSKVVAELESEGAWRDGHRLGEDGEEHRDGDEIDP